MSNGLLSNPFQIGALASQIKPTLQLNQIENFDPVREFTDSNNIEWQLVKAANNATVEIPNPKDIQITDYWNHAFPGIQSKLYVYVVEGIKNPRVETEKPTRVLYQWFSTVWIQSFTPQMITANEWLKANVYAAPMRSARTSKLNAICHIQAEQAPVEEPVNNQLLQIDELSGNGNIAEQNPGTV